MSASSPDTQHSAISGFVLSLMASVTFVGILSELVPSGILLQMSDGLNVSESRVGFLVGIYALASALCAIPLISLTLAVNRKTLLLTLLIGFGISNLIVALTASYPLMVAMRIIGGICAGVMWPMIAAYGTALVPPQLHGRTITIIMAGNTLGISLGLPLMTVIGTELGWRATFIVLSLAIAMIALLEVRYLPSVPGEKLTRNNSPRAVMRLAGVKVVLLLTLLSVLAHYGTYTYITLLVEKIAFHGGTSLALLIFGVGSVLSIVLSARIIDSHLRGLIVSMLLLGALAMLLLMLAGGRAGWSHGAFFLWGVAYGPVVTVYQTAISKLVPAARAVATSLQSSIFNLSIMLAAWLGGVMLTWLPAAGVVGIVVVSIIAFVLAAAIAQRKLPTDAC